MQHGRLLLFICSIGVAFLQPTIVDAKSLAITLDDAPRAATGYFDGPTRAKTLLTELKQHNVPQLAFFAVGSKIDEEGRERLITYANAGHVIAHHSNTHPDFNKASLEDYIADFNQAETALKDLPNYQKWYRFPYLREGDTAKKRDGMRELLQQKGYLNAYITLNNYDWYLENLFQNAIKQGQTVDFEALERLYVSLIMESIEYYDEMAVKHLERSPKHVLLLHEMDITALFLGDLVDELRRKGWSIITPGQAFTDEIVNYEAEKVFKFNPGRIGEIAYKQGQRKGLWHSSLDEKYIEERFESEVIKH